MEFITIIIELIDDRVTQVAENTFERLASVLTGGLEILAVLLIVLYGINVLFRFTEFSFPQLIGIMIRIGAIYMFLFSWENFNIIYSAGTSLFDTVGNTVRDFVAGPASDTSGDAATAARLQTEIDRPSVPRHMFKTMTEAQAVQRQGTIHDLAKAMVFLCSDETSYVSGQNFVVDGGSSFI